MRVAADAFGNALGQGLVDAGRPTPAAVLTASSAANDVGLPNYAAEVLASDPASLRGIAFDADVAARDQAIKLLGLNGNGLSPDSVTYPLRPQEPILEIEGHDDAPGTYRVVSNGASPTLLDRVANASRGAVEKAVGAEELLLGGGYNYAVRIASGVASVPYLFDSADAAAGVQKTLQEQYGYQSKTSGARDIQAAVEPVARIAGDVLQRARDYSTATIGDAPTTVISSTVQFGLEAGGLWAGGRVFAGAIESEFAARGTYSVATADSSVAASSTTSSGTFIFRGDGRPPSVIFDEGFMPRGTNADLLRYVEQNEPSIFVPTSKSPTVAREFAEMQGDGFVYTIRGQANGVDVNSVLGSRSPFPWEMEIAVPGGVQPVEILGARAVGPNGRFTGPFIRNPAYGY